MGVVRLISLLLLLYCFICSLTFLTDAFRLITGKSASKIFTGDTLTNPIVGLVIGVLFTVLVQSSSTCTTVIVALVSSNVVNVRTAIPMIMGANIGTSMTSTLVSLTQMAEPEKYHIIRNSTMRGLHYLCKTTENCARARKNYRCVLQIFFSYIKTF